MRNHDLHLEQIVLLGILHTVCSRATKTPPRNTIVAKACAKCHIHKGASFGEKMVSGSSPSISSREPKGPARVAWLRAELAKEDATRANGESLEAQGKQLQAKPDEIADDESFEPAFQRKPWACQGQVHSRADQSNQQHT